jgi:hypothetical protein
MAGERLPKRTGAISKGRIVRALPKEDGFVLVEAIAALVITAIAAASLMALVGTINGRWSEARSRNWALQEARFLIEEAALHPAAPEVKAQGDFAALGLSWTRTIEDAGEDYPGLRLIKVEVVWNSRQKEGSTRLEAYRIGPVR